MELTARQKQICNFISEFTQQNNFAPTIREIGEAMGLTSSSSVHGHLERLRDRGAIDFERSKPRTIRVLVDAEAVK